MTLAAGRVGRIWESAWATSMRSSTTWTRPASGCTGCLRTSRRTRHIPDLPQFHRQIDECREELARIGDKARQLDIRLSFHPGQYTVLNSPRADVAVAAARDVVYQADLLDAMGCGPEARIVIHVGGVYGDRAAAIDRFVDRYAALPEHAQRRLVVENDEISYSVVDTLAIHERTGVSLVWDILHHRINNPGNLEAAEACRLCLATWPAGQVPKIHFSSERVAQLSAEPEDRMGTPRAKRSGRPDSTTTGSTARTSSRS